MQLLLECARPRRDAAAIRRAAASVGDWSALLQSAARHGMMPLLYWSLNQGCRDVVPGPVLARLRTQFHANGLRNQRFSRELVRLVALCRSAGLEMVPFKGPALAWSLYEDPALRQMCDLDLLVRPADVERAIELLTAAGYEPAYTTDRRFFKGYEELPLTSPTAGVTVDLHWALAPAHFSSALPVERFYTRLVNVAVAGGEVRTLDNRDLLVFLCLHGAKHAWCSLGWVADVARLIESCEFDWDAVVADARARRASRTLFSGLLLAADVLGAAVPDPIVAAMRADSTSSNLAARARDRLLSDAAAALDGHDYFTFQWMLLERGGDKLRFCWGHVPPKLADLISLRLPRAFYPAYYAVRPLRLMAKYGGRFARRILGPAVVCPPAEPEGKPKSRAASA